MQRVLKASGLKYTMHSAGTTVEGAWDEVMAVIGKAHSVVHKKGVLRVQSSMRVGSRYACCLSVWFLLALDTHSFYYRTDKKQTAEDKVKRVNDILASDA